MAKKKEDTKEKKNFAEKGQEKSEEIENNNENFVEETEKSQTETELDALKQQVEQLQKQFDASKEAHIRTLAEYDNFRKRTAKEKEAIFSDSKVKILSELLPVADNFERAAQNSDADYEGYKKGVEMTFELFLNTFSKLGVEPFGKKGDTFDPNFHNAVMHEQNDELGENVIIDVFSTGYKLGDKVLRPAMVKVAN